MTGVYCCYQRVQLVERLPFWKVTESWEMTFSLLLPFLMYFFVLWWLTVRAESLNNLAWRVLSSSEAASAYLLMLWWEDKSLTWVLFSTFSFSLLWKTSCHHSANSGHGVLGFFFFLYLCTFFCISQWYSNFNKPLFHIKKWH